MTNIVDFISKRHQRMDDELTKIFIKRNPVHDLEHLDKLIDSKILAVQDHKLFLAFLTYAEEQNFDPKQLFLAVFQLPKFQFEQQFEMKWSAIVQLSFTFLAILKENNRPAYDDFLKEMAQ